MNLDLTPLGWVHLVASIAALVAAPVVLASAQGTPMHKRRGRIYVAAILVTSTTALGIYRRGVFFFPHWFAIASLLTTALGFAAAHFKVPRTGWVHVHLTCMLRERIHSGGRWRERGLPTGEFSAQVGAKPQLAHCRDDASRGDDLVCHADCVLQSQGMATPTYPGNLPYSAT